MGWVGHSLTSVTWIGRWRETKRSPPMHINTHILKYIHFCRCLKKPQNLFLVPLSRVTTFKFYRWPFNGFPILFVSYHFLGRFLKIEFWRSSRGLQQWSIISCMVMGGGLSVVWPLFKGYSGQSSVRRREWVGTMAGTPPADSRDGSPPCPVGGAHSHTCPAQEVKYNISSAPHP